VALDPKPGPFRDTALLARAPAAGEGRMVAECIIGGYIPTWHHGVPGNLLPGLPVYRERCREFAT